MKLLVWLDRSQLRYDCTVFHPITAELTKLTHMQITKAKFTKHWKTIMILQLHYTILVQLLQSTVHLWLWRLNIGLLSQRQCMAIHATTQQHE